LNVASVYLFKSESDVESQISYELKPWRNVKVEVA